VRCDRIAAHAAAVPTFSEVKSAYRPSDVVLLDRHGVPIQTVRIDKTVRRLPWVPLPDISPALLHALVLSEDRNFYEHSGSTGARSRGAHGATPGTRARAAPRRSRCSSPDYRTTSSRARKADAASGRR
jgi:penicillin-binding protein 1C